MFKHTFYGSSILSSFTLTTSVDIYELHRDFLPYFNNHVLFTVRVQTLNMFWTNVTHLWRSHTHCQQIISYRTLFADL